jgi:uncharacterized protein (TIGR03437 family)
MGNVKVRGVVSARRDNVQAVPASVRIRDGDRAQVFGHTQTTANQDYSFNGASNPAAPGSYVTIYFTGGGQTNPAGVTGSVTGDVLKWLVQSVSVTVGGVPATVAFDGSAPTFVDGVGKLNIQLANNTPSGAQPLVIMVGGVSSATTATISVQQESVALGLEGHSAFVGGASQLFQNFCF